MQNKGRLGIIGAMEIEVESLKKEMVIEREETVSGRVFTVGTLCGKPVVAAVSGVGKVFAALTAEIMILHFGAEALLNTGVAGGLAEGFTIGDIAIATAVVQHDMNTTALGDPRGLLSGINKIELPTDEHLTALLRAAAQKTGHNIRCGTIVSGDLFVAKEKTKERLRKEFGAIACEMEGAAIGHAAYLNGIPFAVLRAISDGGDGMEFSQFVGEAARISTAVTKDFLQGL